MTTPMMKCGHAANAVTKDGKPCCAICWGIKAGSDEIDENPPSLEGRIARCAYFRVCGKQRPSSLDLAFFEYQPDEDYDMYYCGCHGWD